MNDRSLYLLTEAAERTGLTVEALRQRIKRGKLDAIKGNDGMLRVRLTTADLEAIDRSMAGHAPREQTGQPVNDNRLLEALQDAAAARGEATALREHAEMAEARADRAEALAAEIPELRERAGRAEGEAATLREQFKAERNRSVTQMREVEAARDAAKAELAEWMAGGPWPGRCGCCSSGVGSIEMAPSAPRGRPGRGRGGQKRGPALARRPEGGGET